MDTPTDLISLPEAAHLVQRHRTTVLDWTRSGLIVGWRQGEERLAPILVSRAEVLAYAAAPRAPTLRRKASTPPPSYDRLHQRAAEMDEHAPALPDDLLTYTEAAVLTGRGRAAPKEWVRERKVRCWHDVREGVLVALVSRAEVLRFVGGTDVRHRPATDNQRGGARRTRACLRILGRAEEFLMRVGSGDTLGVACRACGIPTATLRHWMRSESAKEDGEIAAFLARLKEARRSAARRRGADVKRPEGGNIRAGLGYFVGAESGDGAVKIGFTARDMDQRFRDLQTGSPVRLMVILTVMAPRAFEPWLHELMAEDRVHGEWFARTARLHALIDALRQHPDVRLTTPSELRRLVEVARSNPLFAPGSDAAA